jgi:HD-GYP domain-containing protein (c-di-GMP phosphodiesterase class II)
VGISLSAEHDIDKLLEMIVEQARLLTHADAGTLYTVSEDASRLDFAIIQNDTLGIRLGGTGPEPAGFPPVPLSRDGAPNHVNVSSHVALTRQVINIPDVYETQDFDFSGPRRYDQATGYRSQSMLVIPLANHEEKIIGVLQLLNAKHPETGRIVPFQEEHQDQVASLASQAAVALTNATLVRDLRTLFESFIKSIATAVDCKSPYTGGHIKRVVELAMLLADRINRAEDGPFKDVHFTPKQMEELRIAAWLHDVGKITTPEHVVDKRTRLETVFDRSELVEARFQLAKRCLEAQELRRRTDLYEAGVHDARMHAELEETLREKLSRLSEDMAFVLGCNDPGACLDDAALARLKAIAAGTFSLDGREVPLLTENELENLCVRRGTLTVPERRVIERHAVMTRLILDEIAFPADLAGVPSYAASHHERLNGTGYPRGLSGEAIPLQARILAIADIFEALTARDRPYKKPTSAEDAVKILGRLNSDGHIDPLLHDLFIGSGVIEEYAALLAQAPA